LLDRFCDVVRQVMGSPQIITEEANITTRSHQPRAPSSIGFLKQLHCRDPDRRCTEGVRRTRNVLTNNASRKTIGRQIMALKSQS
jgi:hypothetical protein